MNFNLKSLIAPAATAFLAAALVLLGMNLYVVPQLAELQTESRGGGVTRFNSEVQMQAGAEVDNGLTVNSGGATVTAGGLTVTAGGATITAGGETITAGGLTVTDGGVVISDDNLRVNDFVIADAAATIAVTAGAIITPTGTYQVITSTAAVTTSTTTAIADGSNTGALLLLRNANAADAIIVDGAGANVECNGNISLGANDVLGLIWNGTDWTCIFLRDNSA